MDTLPSDLSCTWSSVAADGASGSAGSGSGSLSETLSLPAGASVTYTLSCNIDASATGNLSNTATVVGSFDSVSSNNSATDADTLVANADVSITKTNGVTESIPGTSTTYTLVASNAGPSDDPSVSVADTLASSLGCTWTSVAAGGAAGSAASGTGDLAETLALPVGGSVTYTLVCAIDSAATGTLNNTATVTGSFDSVSANNSASDTDTLVASADVSITKTNGVTESVPGTSTTYTLVASNAGPSDDPSVSVADTLPSTLDCTWTSVGAGGAGGSAGSGSGNLSESLSVPAGSSMTYTLVCAIDSAATGTLNNTASITGSFDSVPANNSATDSDTLVASADVSITKTNGVTESVPGTSTTYTVVASNAGPSNDPAVAIADTLPSELSCTWTSVAAGGASGSAGSGSGSLSETLSLPAASSMTYTLSCDIDSAATATLSNTATVVGSFDSISSNNSATDTDTLAASADISITKTNGETELVPGTSTTYTLVVLNEGPSDDSSVAVVDTLPSELDCTWTSVAAGGATGSADSGSGDLSETLGLPVSSSVTYTLECDIDAAATGTLENTATVAGSFDSAEDNDSATDSDTLLGLDYGDAPDGLDGTSGSYPTLFENDGARHVAEGPTLGSLRDTEVDGLPSSDAFGDDNDGEADEDGVVLQVFLACQTVNVSVTASEGALLDAWIDWNQDGDWLEDGEQIFTDEVLSAGPNELAVVVPCDVPTGADAFARFRISTAGALAPFGLALDGEVEDYRGEVFAWDLGDAPAPYPTLLAEDGPRHGAANQSLILGSRWDAEMDGFPSVDADGDDTAVPLDDEDGVLFDLVELIAGQTVTVPVTYFGNGTRSGFLQMWIDFDRDGVFEEGDEQVALDLPVPAVEGASQVDVTFTVPGIDTAGPSYARVRLASVASVLPSGAALDGEVEDYLVQLIPLPTLEVLPVEVLEGASGTTDLVFSLTRSHNLSSASVIVATADGTAMAPADYTTVAAEPILFTAGGDLTRTVVVTVQGEELVELDETFTLEISDPVAILPPSSATGTILNDDSATITLAPAEVLEGDSGSATLTFVATLDRAIDTAVAMSATTVDDSATVGDGDYTPISNQVVTFVGQAGESLTISVSVLGDTVIEAHEQLFLSLTDLQVAGRDVIFEGGAASLDAVGTIFNDDARLTIDDATAPEGDTGSSDLIFTVTLEGAINGGFEVGVETADDTATADPSEPDYVAVADSLIFMGDAGETQTISISVLGDTIPEPTETFFVRLLPPVGGPALPEIEDGEGVGTIEDDDDGVPPTVESIGSNAGDINTCGQLRGAAIRILEVRVEDNRSAILGGDETTDYLLVGPGADGDFATESCTAGVQGDDVVQDLLSVVAVYGETSLAATLETELLPAGQYRLLVCDSITDQAENALDGDGDGEAGGDFVVPFFRSDPGNLLVNGHLDGDPVLCPADLGAWLVAADPPDLVTTGLLEVDDFGDAETSTSIRMSLAAGGGAAVGQCLTVPGGVDLSVSLEARVSAPADVTVLLQLGCSYFAETACTGDAITEQSAIFGLTDEAGNWRSASLSLASATGTASALCEVLTTSSSGNVAYELYLDRLLLRLGPAVGNLIFADGFESGDTSAWQ